MATTTNFGWETPDDTDYVKDGAAAMRTLGNSIDTSFVDLKGGTTGQILSKASNTDLDYTWINNDQGDITGITATSPLTGGGTSGAITVGIQAASTSQEGAVQLTDSTSSTSTTTAATPNSVKSAYDLANAAIPKSTVTTNGDVIYGTGSSAVTRLGIGSTGQILTVAGGVPTWATPAAAAGGLTLVHTETLSAVSSVNIDSKFTSTYANYMVVANIEQSTGNVMTIQYRSGGSTIASGYKSTYYYTEYNSNTWNVTSSTSVNHLFSVSCSTDRALIAMQIGDPQTSEFTKSQILFTDNTYNVGYNAVYPQTTSLDGLRFATSTGSMTGTIRIYGYQNS